MSKETLYFELNRIKLAKLQSVLEKKGLSLEQCLEVADALEALSEPLAVKPAPAELVPFYTRLAGKRTSFLVEAETAERLTNLRESNPDEFIAFIRELEASKKTPGLSLSKKARVLARQAVRLSA